MREALIALAVAVLGVAGWFSFRSSADRLPPAASGEPLFALLGDATLVDAQGQAQTVAASGLAERELILVYGSASWCPPCRAFTPKLVSFHRDHAVAQGLEVLLLSSDETPDEAVAYLRDYRMPWLMVAKGDSAEARLYRGYPSRGIPYLLVFDREGRLRIDGRGRGPSEVLRELEASWQ
jgi:thiol-disulfide isomerase/thioredoxin